LRKASDIDQIVEVNMFWYGRKKFSFVVELQLIYGCILRDVSVARILYQIETG